MNKELRDLIKALRAQGFEVEMTKKNHYLVRKGGHRVATIAGTASDHRSMRNVRSHLRRAGFRDR